MAEIRTKLFNLDNVDVWRVSSEAGVYLEWTADMSLDADGAPKAYHPDDWGKRKDKPLGLDAPENAGKPVDPSSPGPGKWWGVVAEGPNGSEIPIVQTGDSPAQPHKGYWVSTTALANPKYPRGDVRRYVDSATVPYIAIPPILKEHGVKLGDVVDVSVGGRAAAAIVADVGPRKKIGEGSIALAKVLGLSHNARIREADRNGGIRYRVALGSGKGVPLTAEETKKIHANFF